MALSELCWEGYIDSVLMMITASKTLPLHICVHKIFQQQLVAFCTQFFPYAGSNIASNKPVKQRAVKLPFPIWYMYSSILCSVYPKKWVDLAYMLMALWGGAEVWSPGDKDLPHSHQKPLKNTFHGHLSILQHNYDLLTLEQDWWDSSQKNFRKELFSFCWGEEKARAIHQEQEHANVQEQ